MQKIATENNLAETAFIRKEGKKYKLRWFTPLVEIPLCGNGTIASARILWQEGFVSGKEIIFATINEDLLKEGSLFGCVN